MAKRRVLLVDDEVTVLLTMKAVLEISGFDVDTAASAKEAKQRIKTNEYQMIITDMRMESDAAGRDVIIAARHAAYHPAVALLTAFPVEDTAWQEMGADKMLVKPMHVRILLEQIENLLNSHEAKLGISSGAKIDAAKAPAKKVATKAKAKKATSKTAKTKKAAKALPAPKKAVKKSAVKVAKKSSPTKSLAKRTPLKKAKKQA